MKSLTRGSIKASLVSVRTNRARSYLTMLGIIISISSVVTIVAIGQGIKQQVGKQINHIGKDLITVEPARAASAGSFTLLSPARLTGGLSKNDLKTVQKTDGTSLVVPVGVVPGKVHADGHDYTDGPVIATNEGLPTILNQAVEFGVFFTSEDDQNNVAVLGSHVATALFGEAAPLGQSFTFRGQSFVVRGVLNEFSSAPLGSDADFNKAIFIPYGMADQLTNNNAAIYEILAKPTNPKERDATIAALQANLSRLHGNSNDISVLRQEQVASQTNDVLNLLTEMVAGAAAVSLVVGGIGIMNVMLVSVTERMHEVGIRKAVGATNRQILAEFLTEATVLSVIGGIAGIVLAYVVNLLLRILTDLTPIIEWQVVILAVLVSIGVGIVFGSAPALKAARKDPITALRGE